MLTQQASPLIKDQLGLEGTVHTCGAIAMDDTRETESGSNGSWWSEVDDGAPVSSGSCIDELTSLLASVFMVQLVRRFSQTPLSA